MALVLYTGKKIVFFIIKEKINIDKNKTSAG
jgi:hypothetical protein